MRPGRYFRIEHACGHTDGYWLDQDDWSALDSLLTDCRKLAEAEAVWAAELASEDEA